MNRDMLSRRLQRLDYQVGVAEDWHDDEEQVLALLDRLHASFGKALFHP